MSHLDVFHHDAIKYKNHVVCYKPSFNTRPPSTQANRSHVQNSPKNQGSSWTSQISPTQLVFQDLIPPIPGGAVRYIGRGLNPADYYSPPVGRRQLLESSNDRNLNHHRRTIDETAPGRVIVHIDRDYNPNQFVEPRETSQDHGQTFLGANVVIQPIVQLNPEFRRALPSRVKETRPQIK